MRSRIPRGRHALARDGSHDPRIVLLSMALPALTQDRKLPGLNDSRLEIVAIHITGWIRGQGP